MMGSRGRERAYFSGLVSDAHLGCGLDGLGLEISRVILVFEG